MSSREAERSTRAWDAPEDSTEYLDEEEMFWPFLRAKRGGGTVDKFQSSISPISPTDGPLSMYVS